MRVGFIGLGKMGAGIAENILRAGHTVTVWNRSPEPVAALATKGAIAAKHVQDTLQGEVLFSILASDDAMRAVGLNGALLDHAAKGLVHANLATISVDFARRLGAAHEDRGLGYVSANVFGRPDAAAKGELILVAGGAAGHIEALKPVFDVIARRVVIAGERPEQANLFKIAGNFLIASAIEAMGEAFALLRKGGVDAALFHDVLSHSLFAGPVYQGYGSAIVRETFEPAGFALALGRKDVGLALAAATELQVPLPLGDLVYGHFDEAMAAGLADKDWSSVSQVIAKKAGL